MKPETVSGALWTCACLCLFLMTCSAAPTGNGEDLGSATMERNEQRESNMQTAAQQANEFAGRFYGQIAQQQQGNLFFSPLSIHSALSMTFAGSAGETARQMGEVLGFNRSPDEDVEHQAYSQLLDALNTSPVVRFETYEKGGQTTVERRAFELVVANRLWGQEGFQWNPEFIRTARRQYLAGLEIVNFMSDPESARQTINGWVEETTSQRITNLIPSGSLDEMTRLVLTNAIYFKANWQNIFYEQNTSDQPFFLNDGNEAEVPFMTQTERYPYGEGENWQAVELPYELGALSMLVVLPKPADDAVQGVESLLVSGNLIAELGQLESAKVELSLPKFGLEQQLDLASALSEMGMALAFSEGADFSGMSPQARLFLSKALHKAFIEVDEKGTEAAAATAAVVGLTSMPPPESPKILRADRPFIFMIRHNKTDAILFMGRVMDPR